MKYVAAAAVLLGLVSMAILSSPGEKIYTVDEATNISAQLEGQNISVRGTAVQGSVACTQMACIGENQCCNTCSGSVQLEGNKSKINLQGEELGCSGTNCKLNCTPITGEEYIFKGVLKQDYGELRLEVNNYTKVMSE